MPQVTIEVRFVEGDTIHFIHDTNKGIRALSGQVMGFSIYKGPKINALYRGDSLKLKYLVLGPKDSIHPRDILEIPSYEAFASREDLMASI